MACPALGVLSTARTSRLSASSLPTRGSGKPAIRISPSRNFCFTPHHTTNSKISTAHWVTYSRRDGDGDSETTSDGDSRARRVPAWGPVTRTPSPTLHGDQPHQTEHPHLSNPWTFLKGALQVPLPDQLHEEPDLHQPSCVLPGGQQVELPASADRPGSGIGTDRFVTRQAVVSLESSTAVDTAHPHIDSHIVSGTSLDAAVGEKQQHGAADIPPTALSGEELLKLAPATPVILAQTVDDKVEEIIARYRLMEDRLAAVERQMLDLARELRAAPPGSVLAVAHLTAGAAPSLLETAAAASVRGAASADGDGEYSESAPAQRQLASSASAGVAAPETKHLHGTAIVGAATTAAASSTGQQAAADLLSGGGSSQEGKARLFEINRIQAAITEVVNSGYLESVKGLRETLLVQEWGLQAKTWAQRRGVSAFEQWCAEHAAAEVSYETISALYNDPDALHLLPTPRLRMMARAMIEHHTLQVYEEVFLRCTTTAEGLARVGLADLLPHTAGVGQVLRGLLPGGLPFLGAGFWRKGLRWLMPFGGGGPN
ncbi:hypothetical protein VaNZ11_010545 [Volvox africanus]|uniref:Ubiquinone biosynthesis protein n=1 Tax=Volvox africanus TaxID=51714 RepID=A0ABQ5SAN9_9CHLO|nr:hypothetical protein VaNZ11_010545 [Volvox africanus]